MNSKEKDKFRKRINCDDQKRDKGWACYFSPDCIYYKELRNRISWIISQTNGPKMLDIGCGAGITCYLATKREDIVEIHGLDLQEDALEKARLNVKSNKACFHCGFAENLPFKDNYFDTVVIGETLEHVFSEKESIIEAFRVIKSGGKIVITVPNEGKLSFAHIRSFNKDCLIKLLIPYFDIKEMGIVGNFLICVGEKSNNGLQKNSL